MKRSLLLLALLSALAAVGDCKNAKSDEPGSDVTTGGEKVGQDVDKAVDRSGRDIQHDANEVNDHPDDAARKR